MVWSPISLAPLQYQNPADNTPYSGAVLKAYKAGTTTNTVMATDNTGGTTFASVALNSAGYPEHSGTIIIPHIDRSYKLALYANQASADANLNPIWIPDNLSIVTSGDSILDDANNSTMEPVINLTKTTSGTPSVGHGASISYTVETTDGDIIGMELGTAAEDVSSSEDFKLLLKLVKAGAAATNVLEVGSTGIWKFLLSNPQILAGDTDGILTLGAGVTNILGFNWVLYGDTHGKADDLEGYGSATLQIHYDDSASKWDFQANAIATTGVITGLTLEATGAVSASDNSAIGYSAANGLELTGQGSTNDWNFLNDAGASVIRCPTGTDDPVFAGAPVFTGIADFSAAGLKFDNETFDTYDEGTWTPVLSDGTNTDATITSQVGKYTLIGNMCFIKFTLITSSIGSLSGAIKVTGAPFASNASVISMFTAGLSSGLAITAGTNVIGTTTASTTEIPLYVWSETTGTSNMTAAQWSADGAMRFSGVYEI